jgi:hypothetical protein
MARFSWRTCLIVLVALVTTSCAHQSTFVGRASTPDILTFHRDAGRTGWDASEVALTPERVASGAFGRLWASPELDSSDGVPPRLYASPLYVDRVPIAYGKKASRPFSVVIAATSTGFVYAVNAFATTDVAAGTILWRKQLGAPCKDGFDGVTMGVLSTPVIDSKRKRLYVANCEEEYLWRVYALDLTSGNVVPGWPVEINRPALVAKNTNIAEAGVAVAAATDSKRANQVLRAQRGALNLSPDGALLYVTFGESSPGWLASLDTHAAKLLSSFSTTASMLTPVGGIWGSAGAAIDERGNVFVGTGAAFNGLVVEPHNWAQSVLEFASDASGLTLRGTYTPFNYCGATNADVDLGSGGVTLLPAFDSSSTSTPNLLAIGGKQGNVYLLDRARLPGRLDQRPPCDVGSSSDGSLLAPEVQPQFGKPGPLNVFGPYTETVAAINHARSRSVPAYFRDSGGRHYLFVTGATRREVGSTVAVPPGLVRLRVFTDPGKPAYLRIDQPEMTVTLENPGSPVVTSNGSKDAIVWVLDENALRMARLIGPNAAHPMLYAFDALTLKLLWRSAAGELETSGKYNEPAIARGTVFVGTDRVVAYGVRH